MSAQTPNPDPLARLTADLRSIRERMDASTQKDDIQQKAFDQLYEELRQYKDDFIFQAEKPVLLDLLLFFDSMKWFQQSVVKEKMTPEVIADSFQYMIDELLEILYRRDVLPLEPSDTFDKKNHKAVKVVETQIPAEDYTVQQVLKQGFSRSGKLLRAEEVIIARLQRPTEGE